MIARMDVLRMLVGALLVAALAALGAALFDPSRARDPEAAVRAELRRATDAKALAARVDGALAQRRIDDAVMYAGIARFAGIPIRPQSGARLVQDLAAGGEILHETGSFVSGAATEEEDDAAALAGQVVADLVVLGDVRDIAEEGVKLLAGRPYNELVLGLAVVGVALTTPALATSGGPESAKAGVSVLKVAARADRLTPELARHLGRLLRESVDFPRLSEALRATELSDAGATRRAIEAYGEQARVAKLFPSLASAGRLREAAGAGEAVRLMSYVRTTGELDDIAAMSMTLGGKTRGVIEITGKTSVRQFEGGFKFLALINGNIFAFLSWLGALAVLALSGSALRVRLT